MSKKLLNMRKFIITSQVPTLTSTVLGKDNVVILHDTHMQAAREALEQKNAGDFYVVELKVGRVWKVEQKLVEVKAKPESAEEKK